MVLEDALRNFMSWDSFMETVSLSEAARPLLKHMCLEMRSIKSLSPKGALKKEEGTNFRQCPLMENLRYLNPPTKLMTLKVLGSFFS